MANHKTLRDRPRRIEVRDDTLVIDADFCAEVLGGSSARTAKRLESEGLPYIMVAGIKYRPLNAGRSWLADRIKIKIKNQPKRRRA